MVEKDIVDYYQTSKGSPSSKCKECTKEAVRNNRLKNIDYYKEFDRRRANRPDRVAARYEYIRTDKGRAAKARASSAYDVRDPVRYRAHYAVTNAVRDGKLFRAKACEECSSTLKIEGHHDDYTRPLDVRWLCEKCHKDWHRHNAPIYGTA